jgi:hypothetical protein
MELAVLSPSLEVRERSVCIVFEAATFVLDEENGLETLPILAMVDWSEPVVTPQQAKCCPN